MKQILLHQDSRAVAHIYPTEIASLSLILRLSDTRRGTSRPCNLFFPASLPEHRAEDGVPLFALLLADGQDIRG